MTVTGVVRVDLSRFVRDGYLLLADPERYAVYGAVASAGRSLTVQIDVGAARFVGAMDWAIESLREALVGFTDVVVVGDHPRGVAEAVRVFVGICTEAAA